MLVPVNSIGTIGVVKDVAPHILAPQAWTDALNMRFIDGSAEHIGGQVALPGTPTDDVIWTLGVPTITPDTTFFWLHASQQRVFVMDQVGLISDITRASGPYSADRTKRWNGVVFNGVLVVNNGVDLPQAWTPMSTGNPLVALPNWPSNARARTMRAFKAYLVALGVTKAGIEYPRMVKWSHPADPEALPVTWDEADETREAGEYNLSESGDNVVDAVPLGDALLIYKENAVYSMRHVGGIWVFKFEKLNLDNFVGVQNTDWVLALKENHLVFTGDDLVMHNGAQVRSILTGRDRRWLRTNLHPTYYLRSVLVPGFLQDEAWLLFPDLTSSGLCNRALVWNWEANEFQIRSLNGVTHGSFSLERQTPRRRLMLSRLRELVFVNQGLVVSGSPMPAYLERKHLAIPLKQDQPPDPTTQKHVKRIWPQITGTLGGVVKVSLGVASNINAPVSWTVTKDFVIGTDDSVDVMEQGVYLHLRFESDTAISWALHGYTLDVEPAGSLMS